MHAAHPLSTDQLPSTAPLKVHVTAKVLKAKKTYYTKHILAAQASQKSCVSIVGITELDTHLQQW